MRWLLRLFVLWGLLPLGGFLLLDRRGRGVDGEVPRVDGNTSEDFGLRCVASDDEPLGRNATAAFDGITMLNVAGLLRG